MSTRLFAQYHFQNFSVENGLSQSTVYDILKDQKGFMWFCTDHGLDRFDGINMKVYTRESDSCGLSSDRIFAIDEDRQGNFWIGTDFGLNIFDPVKKTFLSYFEKEDSTGISNNNINDIYIDNNDSVWIATNNGLTLSIPGTNKFSKFLCSNVNIKRIYQDKKNKEILWLGTFGNALICFDKSNKKYIEYLPDASVSKLNPANYVNDLTYFRDYLVLATSGGLVVFDTDKRRTAFKKILEGFNYTFSSGIIVSLNVINDSTLWAGTLNDGIVIFNNNFEQVKNLRYNANNTRGLSNNRIKRIFTDPEGLTWIGTNSRGLNIYNSNKEHFKTYRNDIESSVKFTSQETWKIIEDSRKILWIGTDKGLNRFDRSRNKVEWITPRNSSLSDDDVFSILETPDNKLWIGTRSGLDVYDPISKKFVDHLQNREIFGEYLKQLVLCLTLDKDYLWVGTYKGLLKIDYKNRTILAHIGSTPNDSSTLSSERIFAVTNENDSLLWIGTSFGVNLLNKNNGRVLKQFKHHPLENSLSESRVYAIHKDKNNIVWFGTFGAGIDKYDPSTGTFNNYREYNGLANDIVYSILEDKESNLWISTNYGISRFNTSSEQFTNYGVNDGLQALEFNYGASFQSNSGEMFFGGVNGFNSFYPSQLSADKETPRLVITGIKIYLSDENSYNEKYIDLAYSQDSTITLNYNENFFTIDFSVLDYFNPSKNTYAYRIKELQDNYVNISKQNFAPFNNLSPGEYNIQIIGANSRQIWNREGVSLKVIINPPFWKTWWAYLFYSILIITIIMTFLYYRSKLYKREIAVLEKADKLKSEFLAQMSHEIRSPINVILSFSNLLKVELEDQLSPDLKESFNSISRAGTRIIRTIDLILNMSEIQTGTYDYQPKEFDLYEEILLLTIHEYTQKAKEKKLELSIVNNVEKPIVYADEYTIGQVFANLVDNSIKYTDSGSINISLDRNQSGNIIVTIKDTGRGIKEEYLPYLFTPFTQEEQGYTREFEGNGLGLALVKKYCDINRAEISVKSRKGSGSVFTVLFNSNNHSHS